MEYFDLSTEIQDQKYVFSGTDRLSNVDHVWLVNALAFCIVYVCSMFLHSVCLRPLNFMSACSHFLARYNIGSSDGTVSI